MNPADESRATAADPTLNATKSSAAARLRTTMKIATGALIPGSNSGAAQSEMALAEVEYSCA